LAEAHLNIGNALQVLGRPQEAPARYPEAFALRPDFAEAHYHLGLALEKLNRGEEAVAHYERAIAIKPDYADPHNNLGNILRALNRDAEAIEHFERALALKPDYAEAHWNRGAALLTIGDLRAGWLENEWRRLLGVVPRRVSRPLWLGDWNLAGKTILLYAEQGLGDSLQFARYAPLVADLGANVVLEVQPSLASLMAGLRGVAMVRAREEKLPPVDCQCPLLSLPLAFGSSLATIPAEVPYLHAAFDKISRWRATIARGALRIGLKWRANESTGSAKSLPIRMLLPALRHMRLELVALEKDLLEEDLRFLQEIGGVTVLGARLEDFSDTAAVISMLDLIISVDTSVAHLAGAMAKPVWVLLQYASDWRWMRNRDDCPWYPTARLFRQPSSGDWASVVSAVAGAAARLAERSAEGHGG